MANLLDSKKTLGSKPEAFEVKTSTMECKKIHFEQCSEHRTLRVLRRVLLFKPLDLNLATMSLQSDLTIKFKMKQKI